MAKVAELQKYFKFTDNDLKENRKGRVTTEQRSALQEKRNKENTTIIIAGAVIIIVALVISPSSMLMPGVMVASVIVGIVLRNIRKSDISIHSIDGAVAFVWVESKMIGNRDDFIPTRTLKMKVGYKSFDARKELMEIIDQGDACRFYYTGGGDIISAEFLQKPATEN